MISIKKLAITGATAGLLLASAVPAFAHKPQQPGVDIDQSNRAKITNNVTAIVTESGKGDASLGVAIDNIANKNVAVVGNTCTRCGLQSVDVDQSNKARVRNNVTAIVTESGKGDASLGVAISNVVNENVAIVGGGHHR